MGCQILLILFATIESTIAKGVQNHFFYEVGIPISYPRIHPHLRLLEGQRSRRQAVPETTNISTSLLPVSYEASDTPPSVLLTSVAPSISLLTTKFVPRTITPFVSSTIDNGPVATSENSISLLTAPLGSTLQPMTPNFTIFEDNHHYYVSRVATAEEQAMFWIDEKTMYAASHHSTLSESYRSAATIPLSFTFAFYGHEVKQITIATGGFLYMSEFLHQWLTATQYIAPLMANFDTQLGNSSHIRYFDNGTIFVVWWEDVYLQDNHDGYFSFQVMLHKDGRIIFSYKQVPSTSPSTIPTQRHPVKVGLSDAYYVDKPTSSGNSDLRQRTIYEYHRVEINMSQVLNNSAIIITPLPTCSSLKTCEDCINMSSSVTVSFQCHWCPSLGRCSDGLDRNRQEWLESECDRLFPDTVDKCAAAQKPSWIGSRLSLRALAPSSGVSIATAVIITVVLVLIGSVGVWLVYAYKNPNSRSGMWLIQHRPNNLIERVRQVRRGSRISSKYEVAMQPEAESFA